MLQLQRKSCPSRMKPFASNGLARCRRISISDLPFLQILPMIGASLLQKTAWAELGTILLTQYSAMKCVSESAFTIRRLTATRQPHGQAKEHSPICTPQPSKAPTTWISGFLSWICSCFSIVYSEIGVYAYPHTWDKRKQQPQTGSGDDG